MVRKSFENVREKALWSFEYDINEYLTDIRNFKDKASSDYFYHRKMEIVSKIYFGAFVGVLSHDEKIAYFSRIGFVESHTREA